LNVKLRGEALIVAECIVLFLFAGILGLRTLPRAWSSLNTDFPNYYLTASLVRNRADVSRAYEWRWIQRQKDHSELEQPVIGLVPITPFSTLFVYPLSHLPALIAKRVWILSQLCLLIPIAFALRSISGQPLRRIALIMCSCFPLHRNLLFGQYYILLLAMIVFGCWAYVHRRYALAGSLVALAAATKIFPVVFLFYFLRKKNWTALAASLCALAIMAAISLQVFGWSMHRTYLEVVLPATLRGEALPPYTLASSSISTLLHRLFIYEPQWNPHPWVNLPLLAVSLQSVLQMFVLAPSLLLVRAGRTGATRITLEWSALIAATLAISTVPASYNFTLLIFPAVVLCGILLPRKPAQAAFVVLLFLAIGYPGWNTKNVDGWRAILHMQRIAWLLLFLLVAYLALGMRSLCARSLRTASFAWASVLLGVTLCSVAIPVLHARDRYRDNPYRIDERSDALLEAAPESLHGTVGSVALLANGYRVLLDQKIVTTRTSSKPDELSFTGGENKMFTEEATKDSTIILHSFAVQGPLVNGELPQISPDGKRFAYLREDHGRGHLFIRDAQSMHDRQISPTKLNVEEAAFLKDEGVVVAALDGQKRSHLYFIHGDLVIERSDLGEARFPAASSDGKWLAYSHFADGVWNLWLMNLLSGVQTRVADVPCNQMEPAWEPDSKTILYASDCGRALWFTAICRRKIMQ
jgi:hypothetical protein